MLRVGLVIGAAGVRIGGEGRVRVTGPSDFDLPAGEVVRVSAAGDRVRIEGRGDQPAREIRFESSDRSRFLSVQGRQYRGAVLVYSRGGSVYAVNEVGVEAYLRGVVEAEMGTRSANEIAALEAQAIVSRTYALANRGRYRAEGYDIGASVTDQAYLGAGRETSLGAKAVSNTTGLVVTYGGRLASVFFHSTCGYSTALPSEAFRSVQDVAYLQPVSDRRPSGGYYCDISPRFRWSVEWDGEELRNIFRATVPEVLGVERSLIDVIRDVYIKRRGKSGRVTELRIGVGKGEVPVFGPDVRRVLQGPDGGMLGSTAIEIATTRDAAGVVERVEISGAGWGHGVGMCQWGAVGRARVGQSATTIVSAYFPGTRIERWY